MDRISFHAILVICTGNLCRSPVGERLLRRALPGIRVASAGTHGLTGRPADPMAAEVAAVQGLSLEGHVARRLTADMAAEYDLLLVMEPQHLEQVTAIAPQARGKTLLFGQWTGGQAIPDPYRKSREAFEHVHGLLEQAASEWAKRIGYNNG